MGPAALSTARLVVRELADADAPFIVALLNDPDFIRNIGDRGVRTGEDACEYLAAGPLASYARHGFGLCAVALAGTDEPIGICGLLRRDELPGPDIGFAFLPQYRAHGYAFEAAAAVKADAHARLGIQTLFAIVSPATRRRSGCSRSSGSIAKGACGCAPTTPSWTCSPRARSDNIFRTP